MILDKILSQKIYMSKLRVPLPKKTEKVFKVSKKYKRDRDKKRQEKEYAQRGVRNNRETD